MSKMPVKFCENTIIDFLENVLSRHWFHLCSSNPLSTGLSSMKGYVAPSIDDALDWIERENIDRKQNIYFAINAPADKQHKRAKKDELKWLYGCHVDIDLPDEMARNSKAAERFIDDAIARLQKPAKMDGRPHIIMTGNGVQGLWLFPSALKATTANQAAVELVNRRLISEFNAPLGTHNSDRVLRVPGTINWPSAKKKLRGCKPILAELIEVSQDDFLLEDFDRLPEAKAGKIRASAKRVDFTTKPYKDWEPYSFADILADQPELTSRVQEALDARGEHDRSRAAYIFFMAILDFLTRKEDCHAEVFIDDYDVCKNLVEIAIEAEEHSDTFADMVSHYREHEYGLGKMGYDVQRVIADAAEDGKKATDRNKAKAKRKAEGIALDAVPIDEVSAQDARKQFIDFVKESTPYADLPNCVYSGDTASARQLPTEANIRQVMHATQIAARWNVMLDEARYVIDPKAGLAGRKEGKPAEYFAAAVSRSHADSRSAAEESLLLDAFAQVGIVARREIPKLMEAVAKEDRYHPIEEYCKQRKWDGVGRISQVADCLNSKHPLKQRYIELFFFQCVAAVKSLRKYLRHKTGEQLSSVVVLVGPQGIGKSTFWGKVTPEGFMSKGSTLKIGASREEDAKRECLSGLVCNMDEIGASLSRSEAEALKNFLAAPYDEFRTAYAHWATSKPRMTVFVGTSNELLLHDQTGSRRFLAIEVESIDQQGLAEIDLQQVYAEAWHRVMVDGEAWWLDRDEDKERARLNENHRAISEEESAAESYFAHVTDNHRDEWLAAKQICDVLGLRYSPSRWHVVRAILDREGCDYRETMKRTGKPTLRKVYGFPVLPERYAILTSHA